MVPPGSHEVSEYLLGLSLQSFNSLGATPAPGPGEGNQSFFLLLSFRPGYVSVSSFIYLCIEPRTLGMLGKSSIPSATYLFSPRDFLLSDMSGSDPPQYSVSDCAVGDPVEGTALFSVGTFTQNSREVWQKRKRDSLFQLVGTTTPKAQPGGSQGEGGC